MIWFRPREGSFGFALFGWWLYIKAPWKAPMFSERYSYEKWSGLGFGWRFKFRKIKRK